MVGLVAACQRLTHLQADIVSNSEHLAVVVSPSFAKAAKSFLEERRWLDQSRRIGRLNNGIAIPVCSAVDLACLEGQFPFEVLRGNTLEATQDKRPQDILKSSVLHLARESGIDVPADISDIPQKWERHHDLVLFPVGAFAAPCWEPLKPRLWAACARALQASRIALKARIATDDFRSPVVTLVLGDDPMVRHVDNGVVYEFDITRSMFSAGNIREKLRVAAFDCRGETVVDLYAGIGYFALPYLVHAGAARLYACEWNPAAVAALRRNAELNGVAARCVVLPGDNAAGAPRGVADRVNLGLIPSSRRGWPVAARCLRPDRGGRLHVHENVTSSSAADREQAWRDCGCAIAAELEALLAQEHGGPWRAAVEHIEPVKSYAPHVDHLVFDIVCRPVSPSAAASEGCPPPATC